MNEQLTKSEIKKRIINLAIEEYKNLPEREKSIARVSSKYGINKKTLKKYLDLNHIKINYNHGFNFNEHIFDFINTEEKAYWLGFLYADGSIGSKTNTVELGLSIKDLNHLYKFKKFLNWPGDIKISEDHQFNSKKQVNKNNEPIYRCRIAVSSKTLWTALNKAGCVPNKSLILTFPNESLFSNKKLIYDFIRGYFDGDGTLGLYKHSKNRNNLEESLIIIGTKNFLEGIEKYLGKGFLMQKSNCNKLTYRLSYSTKKAFLASKLMYENATIYLDRKYDIYINKFAANNRVKTVKAEMLIPC